MATVKGKAIKLAGQVEKQCGSTPAAPIPEFNTDLAANAATALIEHASNTAEAVNEARNAHNVLHNDATRLDEMINEFKSSASEY